MPTGFFELLVTGLRAFAVVLAPFFAALVRFFPVTVRFFAVTASFFAMALGFFPMPARFVAVNALAGERRLRVAKHWGGDGRDPNRDVC